MPRGHRIRSDHLASAWILWLTFTVVQSSPDYVVDETLYSLGFGSCHKPLKASNPPVWDSIISKDLDSWLWLGDSVYPRSKYDPTTGEKVRGPTPLHMLKDLFDEMHHNHTVGYAKFHPRFGIFGTHDDHDYGGNDFGKKMPDREARRKLYFDFLQQVPPAGRDVGVYSSVTFGKGPQQVHAIFLDTRSFRDDHCIPSVASYVPLGNAIGCATRWWTAGLNLFKFAKYWGRDGCGRYHDNRILGEQQWQWLEEQLQESQAQLILMASSIQVLTTNAPMESWGHFPSEQQRLVNLLEQHRQKGGAPVVLLSGDVHHAEFLSPTPGLLEITSSGMTHHCGQGLYGPLCKPLLEGFNENRKSPKGYYIGMNYGTLTMDWEERIARFEVHSHPEEQTVMQLDLPLTTSEIQIDYSNDVSPVWNGHLIKYFLVIGIITLIIVAFLYNQLASKRRRIVEGMSEESSRRKKKQEQKKLKAS